MNRTILEKIGISDRLVSGWRRKGLIITYPIKENLKYYKSEDGKVFHEQADKFVPLLTSAETKLYINNPEKFKTDLLKNTKFFRNFIDFLYKKENNLKILQGKEKVCALLSLLYLFQRAMDYHYYHWDRYLVYENYPKTPVGYWWKKLKDLYAKYDKKPILKQQIPEDFLKLLSKDTQIIGKFKLILKARDFLKLKKTLKAIKIFEDAQQKEVGYLIDYKSDEKNALIRTAFPLMISLWEELDKFPNSIKAEHEDILKKIKKLHPIIAGRRITLTSSLRCFNDEIIFEVEKEIKRWT